MKPEGRRTRPNRPRLGGCCGWKPQGSDGRSLFVRLEGDLDIYSTRDLSNRLHRAELGATDLVVDLSRLNFIDCAGLHQLVEAGQRARSQGRRLKLIKGPERVHRVFQLTGLESGFEFAPAEPG